MPTTNSTEYRPDDAMTRPAIAELIACGMSDEAEVVPAHVGGVEAAARHPLRPS
jgi:hypothetical protein